MIRKLAIALPWMALSCLAQAHGLSPQRLVVDAGAPTVVVQLRAINNYKQQDRFSVECFKHDLGNRWPCQAMPQLFIMSHNATKKIKVKLNTEGDDVYLVCTVEEPDEAEYKAIISRVCARIGVGVDPTPGVVASKRPKHRAAADAVAAGARPNQVR